MTQTGPRRSREIRVRALAKSSILASTAMLVALMGSSPCFAQTGSDIEKLRQELQALKAEQASTSNRIATIEHALDRIAGTTPAAIVAGKAGAPMAAATVPAASSSAVSRPTRLQFSGDVRVRYEANEGDDDARNRHRGVLRARLRSSYAISDRFMVGAQLSTGDSGDPNTADVTLGNFDDDLPVSLDQIYARASFGYLTLTAGKIPMPFKRTDLVWDGDVSPQGLSSAYKLPIGDRASLKATGLYFLIDEAGNGPDTSMIGGQLELAAIGGNFRYEVAASYYDYRINAISSADAGDFRSNRRRPDGSYLSDFNMVDVIASAEYSGLGEKWPIQIVGNYVHNFAAATRDNTGFGVDAFVGRTSMVKDWRFGYGYAQAEVDAVFAAFSNDNLGIATNYKLHTLSIDYVPAVRTLVNLTWYHYKPLEPLFAGRDMFDDWLERIRLNFVINF